MSWLFPSPVTNTMPSGSDIKKAMRPVQEFINQQQLTAGQMQGGFDRSMLFAQEMMDPSSQYNAQQQRMMKDQSNEQMAMQAMLQRRQAAATGQTSGITSAQGRLGQENMMSDMRKQYQQQLLQQRMAGMQQFNQSQGLLGNIASLQGSMGQQQLGIQENMAQADIARAQMQMQQEQAKRDRGMSLVSGLMGGVLSGGASVLGSALGEGGAWS
jgi:hypothetical protein